MFKDKNTSKVDGYVDMDIWIREIKYPRTYGIAQNGRKLTTEQPEKIQTKSIEKQDKALEKRKQTDAENYSNVENVIKECKKKTCLVSAACPRREGSRVDTCDT